MTGVKIKKIKGVQSHFLDSGAFSLKSEVAKFIKNGDGSELDYYKSDEFKSYMDRYAAFIKKYKAGIDHYANIDVIGNPKLTWENQKYLEEKHGLWPVPVVHFQTDHNKQEDEETTLDKYIKRGHTLIGLGGLANIKMRGDKKIWLDRCFSFICNTPDRTPKVRIHGFGVSSPSLWRRYPWWSMDSTSIHKKAAYGWILIPYYRQGMGFRFDISPMHVSVSEKSPLKNLAGKHIETLPPGAKAVMLLWLNHIKVPYGNKKEKGVSNDGAMRSLAIFHYYEMFAKSLPKYPWSFKHTKESLFK